MHMMQMSLYQTLKRHKELNIQSNCKQHTSHRNSTETQLNLFTQEITQETDKNKSKKLLKIKKQMRRNNAEKRESLS